MRARNNVIYAGDNIIAGCHNLNQCATWLEEKYKYYSEDERELIKSLFEGTYTGEIIKLIEKKSIKKKTKKKPTVVKVENDQPEPIT